MKNIIINVVGCQTVGYIYSIMTTVVVFFKLLVHLHSKTISKRLNFITKNLGQDFSRIGESGWVKSFGLVSQVSLLF